MSSADIDGVKQRGEGKKESHLPGKLNLIYIFPTLTYIFVFYFVFLFFIDQLTFSIYAFFPTLCFHYLNSSFNFLCYLLLLYAWGKGNFPTSRQCIFSADFQSFCRYVITQNGHADKKIFYLYVIVYFYYLWFQELHNLHVEGIKQSCFLNLIFSELSFGIYFSNILQFQISDQRLYTRMFVI